MAFVPPIATFMAELRSKDAARCHDVVNDAFPEDDRLLPRALIGICLKDWPSALIDMADYNVRLSFNRAPVHKAIFEEYGMQIIQFTLGDLKWLDQHITAKISAEINADIAGDKIVDEILATSRASASSDSPISDYARTSLSLLILLRLFKVKMELAGVPDNLSIGPASRKSEYSAALDSDSPQANQAGEQVGLEALNKAYDEGFHKISGQSNSESGCFIATVAMGSNQHGDVVRLRLFRDAILNGNRVGEILISAYYRYGPVAAGYCKSRPLLRYSLARLIVRPASFIAGLALPVSESRPTD